MTTFAEETLELARSLTAHRVEINSIQTDADFTAFSMGDHITVIASNWRGHAWMQFHDGAQLAFGNVTAAIQAADTYETVMLAIREAAKISREKVPA